MGRPNSILASSSAPVIVRQQVEWLMERSVRAAMLTDPTGLIEYVNPAFQTLSGYARSEAIGQTPAILKSGLQSRETFDRLWSTLQAGGEFDDVLVNRRKSGEIYHQEQTIQPLFDAQGRVTHFLASGRDISERIATIERLTRAATHDSLTDLPNRALFLDRLDLGLSQARRSGEGFAIALLDVDRFKAVNDSLGHAAGDVILRSVAQRLRHCVREVDTVARLGGDEFGLLLPGAVDTASAAHALRKIVAAFAAVATEEGQPAVSVSVGACLGSATDDDGRVLLALADDAMYFAKRRGGNAFHLCHCDRHVCGVCR